MKKKHEIIEVKNNRNLKSILKIKNGINYLEREIENNIISYYDIRKHLHKVQYNENYTIKRKIYYDKVLYYYNYTYDNIYIQRYNNRALKLSKNYLNNYKLFVLFCL